jgi:hypothetical protein
MPYEVTISGGAPWGFRLSGGVPSPDGIKVRLVFYAANQRTNILLLKNSKNKYI